MRDHYKTLDLPPRADLTTVRRAYREMMRRHHPDAGRDPLGNADLSAITEAYRVLSDPERRRQYDAVRVFLMAAPLRRIASLVEDAQARQRLAHFVTGAYRAIFAATERGGRRGANLRVGHAVDFRTGYAGGVIEVAYRRRVRCESCRGTGRENVVDCSTCAGRGTIEFPLPGRPRKTCPRCGGVGLVGDGRCEPCQGRGAVNQMATASVRLPAGLAHGALLRLRGKGDQGIRPDLDGDLFVELAVDGSLRYAREGRDLRVEKSIPLELALNGGRLRVGLPDDRTIDVTVPAITGAGVELRVAALGFAGTADTPGDLVLKLDVHVPDALDAAGRRVAGEWLHLARTGEDPARLHDLTLALRRCLEGVA